MMLSGRESGSSSSVAVGLRSGSAQWVREVVADPSNGNKGLGNGRGTTTRRPTDIPGGGMDKTSAVPPL